MICGLVFQEWFAAARTVEIEIVIKKRPRQRNQGHRLMKGFSRHSFATNRELCVGRNVNPLSLSSGFLWAGAGRFFIFLFHFGTREDDEDECWRRLER